MATVYSGTENLFAMESLVRYNEHVYGLIAHALPARAKILELGPGIGEFTKRFHRDGIAVDCVELEKGFHPVLRRFSRSVVATLAELPDDYDAVVSVNVLEHVKDDASLSRELCAKLKPGGVLALYLPAHPALYSHMDRFVGHHRRYAPMALARMLEAAGFSTVRLEMVDSLGVLVSLIYKWLNHGDGKLEPGPMRLYDKLVFPVSKVIDRLLGSRFGRNVFIVARKV